MKSRKDRKQRCKWTKVRKVLLGEKNNNNNNKTRMVNRAEKHLLHMGDSF